MGEMARWREWKTRQVARTAPESRNQESRIKDQESRVEESIMDEGAPNTKEL